MDLDRWRTTEHKPQVQESECSAHRCDLAAALWACSSLMIPGTEIIQRVGQFAASLRFSVGMHGKIYSGRAAR